MTNTWTITYYGRAWELDKDRALRVSNDEDGYVGVDTYTREQAPTQLYRAALELEALAMKLRDMAEAAAGVSTSPTLTQTQALQQAWDHREQQALFSKHDAIARLLPRADGTYDPA